MEPNPIARCRGQPAVHWPPSSWEAGSGTPHGAISFHSRGAGRHPAGSGHGFIAPFCRSCTWGNWQQKPTSPGPRLEVVITEWKELLFTRGQCQAYFLLQQGAPQERPLLSSTPSQAQIIEKFSMQPESIRIAAWTLLGNGFTWIGSDREARPGQRWVWQTEGGRKWWLWVCSPFIQQQQCCPEMASEHFLIFACRWAIRTLLGVSDMARGICVVILQSCFCPS